MSIAIRIPVYPHVRRYLEVQYGNYIVASDRNCASILIRSMLKKFDKKDPSLVRPSEKLNLGATYDILIGQNRFDHLGGYLDNEDILKFSKSIDLLIRQEMYRWCNHPNATDQVIDFNIRRFVDYYGFDEDDLPFDNLKRWYFRERQRYNKRVDAKLISEYKTLLSYAAATNDLSVEKINRFQDLQHQINPAKKVFQLKMCF